MKLFFQKMGEGSPIVILHGLFGSSDNWLTIGKKLLPNYSVYLMDLRNHGKSPHHPQIDFQVMADDIQEFITAQNIAPAVVIGHSMGGKVAMNLALEYPQLVEKLVVVDVAPKAYPTHYFEKIIRSIQDLDVSSLKSRKQADEKLTPAIPNKLIRGFLLKNLYHTEADTYQWRINIEALANNIENISGNIPSVKQYHQATLFIRGGKSNYICDEIYGAIMEKFPSSEIVTIPSAGHWIHSDSPAEFMATLQNFFGRKNETLIANDDCSGGL